MSRHYLVRAAAEENWLIAEKQPLVSCAWSPHPAPKVSVQALWLPERALLFRLECAAPPTRAENREDDAPVWEDSCLECFFSADGTRYVNLEANANGALLAAVGAGRQDRTRLSVLGLPRPSVRCRPCGEGWEAVFSVPADCLRRLFGLELAPGLSLRANFYACGDKTPRPHYAAWSEPRTPAPDFHRPEFFGTLILGD